jgi:hypothetical protein
VRPDSAQPVISRAISSFVSSDLLPIAGDSLIGSTAYRSPLERRGQLSSPGQSIAVARLELVNASALDRETPDEGGFIRGVAIDKWLYSPV